MTDESQNNNTPQPPTPEEPSTGYKHINFAMQGGVYIGLGFALTAISWFFYHIAILQGLLALTGFIMIPVLLILVAIRYRDNVLGGRITYLRSVGFMTWSYLFAMIISMLAYYAVFTILFRSPEFMAGFEASIESFLQMIKDNTMRETYKEAMMGLTPRSITLNIATSQLFFGLIFMYIAALFVRR